MEESRQATPSHVVAEAAAGNVGRVPIRLLTVSVSDRPHFTHRDILLDTGRNYYGNCWIQISELRRPAAMATTGEAGRRRRAAVVVLGDIRRNPCMQYHSLSLANQAGTEVDIVANGGGSTAKILAEDISHEYHRKRKQETHVVYSRVENYIRSSLCTAFAQFLVYFGASRHVQWSLRAASEAEASKESITVTIRFRPLRPWSVTGVVFALS
ncbi:hypothetical protein ABZP36_009812 [Zizania latifolia]